ncbi:MAG: hypothetical protein CVT67_06655 [Actinobacteria bacterium HGW-Actinobacteria-7]|nr:MAG: hypothetical protein CVT67_06655 [Actinobacteria bacterium HGW-Actinobacteria-7]
MALMPSLAAAIYIPSAQDSLVLESQFPAATDAMPYAVTLGPAGTIYYTYFNASGDTNMIVGMTSIGTEIFSVGFSGYTDPVPYGGLDFTPSGDLAFADTNNDQVRLINAVTGQVNLTFGSSGSEATKFSYPSGLCVTSDSHIWVADSMNDRVQKFDEAGGWLGELPVGAFPDGISVGSNGDFWVALLSEGQVRKYDSSGTLLQTISSWEELDGEGNPVSRVLYSPRAVAVDPWGVIYVLDQDWSQILRFSPTGEFLGRFNPSGVLAAPMDMDMDALGNLYVADLTGFIYKFRLDIGDQDITPPTTTSNITEGWLNWSPFMLALQSSDASSAVTGTYYSIDGSEPTLEYSTPVTITAQGTSTVKYFSIDAAENIETVHTETLTIDSVAPITSIVAPSYVYGNEATVTLAATDAVSGLSRIEYRLSGGDNFKVYTGPFLASGVGTQTVEFFATDNASNYESLQSQTIYFETPDVVPPTTSSNIPAGWIDADHTIIINAADDRSGVAATYVSTDGAPPTTPYRDPIPVTSEGTMTVKYYSVDGRDNTETVKTDLLRIDKTKPWSTSDATATYVDSATINFQAFDTISGVLDLAYSVDNGPLFNSYQAHVDSWGNHSITWYATDRAGNRENLRSASFVIWQPDNEPPVTGDNIASSWTRGPVHIQLDATDAVSGVAATYYSTDGTTPTVLYEGPFDFNGEGQSEVKFYSEDTRGNKETIKTRTVRIDNSAPESSSDALSEYVGTAAITLASVDPLSGVNGIWYHLDDSVWTKGANGVVVTTSTVGPHVLEYYGVDSATNQETTHTALFSVTSPDMVPPITTLSAPSTWVSATVLATLSAYDASSTVVGTWYSIDGSTPSIPYTGAIPISAEGTTTIKYRSVDFWGNVETTNVGTVRVDKSPPITTSDASLNYVDLAEINLTPSDAYSGVATTKYRVDGGSWKTGTLVSVIGYSSHTLQYYSTDNAGNTESAVSVSFSIRRSDKTFQQTDSNILYKGTWADAYSGDAKRSSTSGAAIWFYAQASRIRWAGYRAPDAGIARVSIDGGAWTNIDLYSSFTYSQYVWDSGDLDFDYHLVKIEYTGNKNSSSSGTAVNLDALTLEGNLFPVPDTAAPVTTSNIDSAWQRGPVSVSLSSIDVTTGVQATYYSTDGSVPSVPYTAPVSISAQGTTTFKFFSVDNRGNAETVVSQSVKIDDSAPITGSDAKTSYLETATVTFTAADPFSGVAYTKWRVDGSSWTTGSVAQVGNNVGEHSLEWYSVDVLGNSESIKSFTVAISRRFENTDTAIIYQGPIVNTVSATKSGGSWHFANGVGATAFVRFMGTGIDLISTKGAAYGIAKVTVDGGSPVFIDFFSPSSVHQTKVWGVSALANGNHQIKFEWTGTKNGAASATDFGLDAFDVIGALAADTVSPTTTLTGSSAWRSTPQTLSLAASDDFGYVTNTYYRIGSTTTTYTGPFSISAEGGQHRVDQDRDGQDRLHRPHRHRRCARGLGPRTGDDAPERFGHPFRPRQRAVLHRRLRSEPPLYRQHRRECRGHHHGALLGARHRGQLQRDQVRERAHRQRRAGLL